VLHDVLEGLVSAQAARDVYGVAVTGSVEDDTLAIDEQATAALRGTPAGSPAGAGAAR
jgi:N-methylhydantoinase B